MKNLYTEENLDRVERYLSGQLTAAEQQAFEKEMSEDADLQQLVEEHRLVIEGVKVAAYREDKRRLDAIHQAMLEEGEEDMVEVEPVPVQSTLTVRRITSIAAVLAVGIVLGIFGMRLLNPTPAGTDPIAGVDEPVTDGYGGVPDGLPLYEATVPLVKVRGDEQGNAEITRTGNIDVMIFQNDRPAMQYHFENGILFLITDKAKNVSDWNEVAVEVMLQEWVPSEWQISLVRINDNTYQIPLDHETFNLLFDQ